MVWGQSTGQTGPTTQLHPHARSSVRNALWIPEWACGAHSNWSVTHAAQGAKTLVQDCTMCGMHPGLAGRSTTCSTDSRTAGAGAPCSTVLDQLGQVQILDLAPHAAHPECSAHQVSTMWVRLYSGVALRAE